MMPPERSAITVDLVKPFAEGMRLVPRNTGLPLLGSVIAALLEPCEEGPIEVERARLAEPFDAIFRRDAVKAQPLQPAT